MSLLWAICEITQWAHHAVVAVSSHCESCKTVESSQEAHSVSSSCEFTVSQLNVVKMSFPWVSMWAHSELAVSPNSSMGLYLQDIQNWCRILSIEKVVSTHLHVWQIQIYPCNWRNDSLRTQLTSLYLKSLKHLSKKAIFLFLTNDEIPVVQMFCYPSGIKWNSCLWANRKIHYCW